MNNADEPVVSVITCAHNEESYVGKCLSSIRRALKGIKSEMIFVADRCTDNTVKIAKMHKVDKLVEKTWKKWQNSYAEALQAGYFHASGRYVSIIDADIVLPEDFFEKLIPLIDDKVVSVSAIVRTFPSTLLNRLVFAWERTHEITPFGRRPRGAARVILRQALCEIKGFRDVPAPDTDIDLRLAEKGYESVYSHVKVWHIREITLGKILSGQLGSGRARYYHGIGFTRTMGHAIFRARPLVVYGWLLEWIRSKI